MNKSYFDDIKKFARKVILKHHHPFFFGKQRYKVALTGRGDGKSTSVARAAILILLCTHGTRIVFCRKHWTSIKESSHEEISKNITELGLEKYFEVQKECIKCPSTDGYIFFAGLEVNKGGIKSTSDIDIAVVEECADVSLEALEKLFPTVRSDGSQIWLIGNPSSPVEATSQLFLENEPPPDTIIMYGTYLDNPYTTEVFKKDAEHMKNTDIDRYNHVYLGQYLNISDDKVFSIHKIKESIERPYDNPTGIIKAGLDVARGGKDNMVLTVVQGKRCLHIQSWNHTPDFEIFADELVPILFNWKVDSINIDLTGMGGGIRDILNRRVGKVIHVHGMNVGIPSYKEGVKLLKDELVWDFREWLYNGGSIPNNAQLIEDLHVSRYTYASENRWTLVPKDVLKNKHGHRSTDFLDSIALAIGAKEAKDYSKIMALGLGYDE